MQLLFMNCIKLLLGFMIVLLGSFPINSIGGNGQDYSGARENVNLSANRIDQQNANDTPVYVLVHGGNMTTATWNKLTVGKPVYTKSGYMGDKIWEGTVSFLAAHNYRAFAPTLKDDHIYNLTDHINQICDLIVENNLTGVILVGHSYGGLIITGVAARMPERIRRMVYLDSAWPEPGQSLYDAINSSGVDPKSIHGLESYPPYVEKQNFDPQKIKSLPKTFIRCTNSTEVTVTNIAKQKIAADPEGWTYIEIPSSHVPMADMPEKFYQLMLDAAKK